MSDIKFVAAIQLDQNKRVLLYSNSKVILRGSCLFITKCKIAQYSNYECELFQLPISEIRAVQYQSVQPEVEIDF